MFGGMPQAPRPMPHAPCPLHFVHNWSLVAAIIMPMTMPVGRMISQQQLSSVYCYLVPGTCYLLPLTYQEPPSWPPCPLTFSVKSPSESDIVVWSNRSVRISRSTSPPRPGPRLCKSLQPFRFSPSCHHATLPPTLLNTLAKGRASWNFIFFLHS